MDEEVKPNEVDVCRSGDLTGHTKGGMLHLLPQLCFIV